MLVHARRMGLIALVLGVAFLSGGIKVAAQANVFMGQWELDRFKSVYEPIETAPQKQLLTIAAGEAPGQFRATTKTWRAEVASETSYTAAADGKDYPTTAAQATVAFKAVNANTWQRTAKLMNTVAETATWTVSANGRLLTITREGTDAAGNAYKSTAYYNKIG